MPNPYRVVRYGKREYGVECKDYPQVGLPNSWGSLEHARTYMANLLGLTHEEFISNHAPSAKVANEIAEVVIRKPRY